MKTKLSYGENIKDEEYVIVNIIIRIYCIFFKKRTQLIFFPKICCIGRKLSFLFMVGKLWILAKTHSQKRKLYLGVIWQYCFVVYKICDFRSVPDSLFKHQMISLIQYPTLEILHRNWLGVRTFYFLLWSISRVGHWIRDLNQESGTDLLCVNYLIT